MKRTLVLLLSCVAALAAAPGPPARADVRTVYLLPMGFGFDQFLANHLAASGAFDVVTDPKLAETVLTDRIGQGLEAQLAQLYGEKTPREEQTEADAAPPRAGHVPPVGAMSAFGRGKGNLFLVDVNAGRVIWSTYEKPAGSDPGELNRAAERVVARLQKHMLKLRKNARAAAPPPAAEAPPPPAPKQ